MASSASRIRGRKGNKETKNPHWIRFESTLLCLPLTPFPASVSTKANTPPTSGCRPVFNAATLTGSGFWVRHYSLLFGQSQLSRRDTKCNRTQAIEILRFLLATSENTELKRDNKKKVVTLCVQEMGTYFFHSWALSSTMKRFQTSSRVSQEKQNKQANNISIGINAKFSVEALWHASFLKLPPSRHNLLNLLRQEACL